MTSVMGKSNMTWQSNQSAGMQSPAGGFKESGIGREGGLEGFDAYVETRSISLPGDLVRAESVRS